MTQDEYDRKREARIERLENAASKAEETGNALVDGARQMASVIPFGQPILIGHHSEKRDRNYRGRIENKFRKGFEELDKAKYYERRAEAAASNRAIFSDDPSASEQLEAKIERLEKRQDLMRSANKALRQALKLKDDAPLLDLGFSEADIAALKTPDCFGGLGYASFKLTNNAANIRRLKQRLQAVKANANREEKEYTIGAFRIVESVDQNRVQLFFAKDLLPQVKEQLKSHGFHFSWENTCWQRQLNDTAVYYAQRIAGSQRARFEKETETIRSVPENYCLATRNNPEYGQGWHAYRHEGATRQWHDAFEKACTTGYHASETDLAAKIGACLQASALNQSL